MKLRDIGKIFHGDSDYIINFWDANHKYSKCFLKITFHDWRLLISGNEHMCSVYPEDHPHAKSPKVVTPSKIEALKKILDYNVIGLELCDGDFDVDLTPDEINEGDFTINL